MLTLTFSKSTKNMHVYTDSTGVIPTLYIDRVALPKPPPEIIHITITVPGEIADMQIQATVAP